MSLSSMQCSSKHSHSDTELKGTALPAHHILDTPAFGPSKRSNPWIGLTLVVGNLLGLGALEAAAPCAANAALAPREGITRSASSGLTDLSVDGSKLTALYDDKQVSGELDATKAIKSLRYGEVTYTPATPLPFDELKGFMKRFDAAVYHVVSADIGLTVHSSFEMKSADDYRFELTVHEEGGEIRYVATPTGVARVDRIFTEQDGAQLAELRADVEKQSKGAAADLSAALGRDHEVELAVRGERAWTMARAEAVEEKIEGYIDARKLHPVARETWEKYLDSFREKTGAHRRILEKNPHSVGWASFRGAISELDKKLVEFEKNLGITPPSSGYSTKEAIFVLERIERSRLFNERLTAVENALGTNTEISAQQRSAWRSECSAKRQSFDSLFGRPYGWERWDPASLAQEKHRSVMAKLDEWLSPIERELGITPETPNSAVSRKYTDRLERFERAVSSRDALADRERKRELVDVATGERIIEQQSDSKPEGFDRYIERGERFEREWYESGRRTWLSEGIKGATERISQFSERGTLTGVDEWIKTDGRWSLERQTQYRLDGTSTVSEASSLTYEIKKASGEPLGRIRYGEDAKSIRELSMFGDDGKGFGNYQDEKARTPGLTHGKYLDLLAAKLDTPQKIHVYLDLFMRYTYDDSRDVWQASATTLDRVDNKKMLGDCDDYAFLVRDILRRQGLKPEVLCIPSPPHALCVWLEKRADGRYDAHSICTFGYDKNGNRHLHEENPEKAKGYATKIEAMQSLMEKYKEAGAGVDQGAAHRLNANALQILDLNGNGKIWRWVTIDHFANR